MSKTAFEAYKRLMEQHTKTSIQEGLGDDMASLAKSMGMNVQVRKPGEKQQSKPEYVPKPVEPMSVEQIAQLKNKLKELKSKFDPNYQRSDDYSEYARNHRIAGEIRQIENTLRQQGDSIDEGTVAKVGGVLALMAAVMGLGNELTSAKHTPLGNALAVAAQRGDQEAAKHLRKLDTYIDTKQTALVTELSNEYLNNQNESAVMKGIQNETAGFKNNVVQQQLDYVNKIKSSNMKPWEKEYLIKANHPSGKVFKTSYISFPKGERARKMLAQEISSKYGVSIEDVERLELSARADMMNEAKKMKGKDPCWSGYEMIGKKKKDGKEVPNCVPKKK